LTILLFVLIIIILVNPFTLSAWFIWGIDDLSTHYFSDSSIQLLYRLKCTLFDLNESLFRGPVRGPTAVDTLEFSLENIYETSREPHVIRGLFSKSRAIETWRDVSYMERLIGNETCQVVMDNANHFEKGREFKSYREIFTSLR